MAIILLVLGSVAVACYFYLVRNYNNYWRDRKIPFAKGAIPGFGHTCSLFFLRTSLVDLLGRVCGEHPNRSMVGFHYQTTPALIIREPELIKTVMLTNFSSFSKNLWKLDPDQDRVQSLNPFFAYGDTWLISRKHLSMAFTSRNLKFLTNYIEQICKKLEDFLNDNLRENNKAIELDLHHLAVKYTLSVASSASFSVDSVNVEDESGTMTLSNVADKILGLGRMSLITQTLNFYFPTVKNIFGVSFVPKKVDRFFSGLVNQITQIREEDHSERKTDFLNLMLDLKEDGYLDNDMITAHTLTFFMNMNETSSVVLGFVAYQLARNPLVQRKLRAEVKSVLAKYDGRITYDGLKEMAYLDQVINESQRLYPTVTCFGKVCTEEFELKGSDGLSCRVQPGTVIFTNVLEMHRSPKYWRDPDAFDPDRFDSKTKVEKYAFLPFGEGPRVCPAKRLALLQTKAYLATLVNNYSVEVSPKTLKEPIQFMPGRFLTTPVGGLWAYIKPLISHDEEYSGELGRCV